MRTVALICLLLCGVALVTSTSDLRKHRARGDPPVGQFRAAGPTDCRSPCPGLNTLANHGHLPRDGKNITKEQLVKAAIDVLGANSLLGGVLISSLHKKFAVPGTNRMSLCTVTTNIHTADLPAGGAGVEHSASMSRVDRPKSDFSHGTDSTQVKPDPQHAQILFGSSKDKKTITMKDFAEAKKKIWDKSYLADPKLRTDPKHAEEVMIGALEGCLLMGLLGGNSNTGLTNRISLEYAKSFLLQETFPAGWKKNSNWGGWGFSNLLACMLHQGVSMGMTELRAAVNQWVS
jgi:hypothetical protein